jgi:hypothetical protein
MTDWMHQFWLFSFKTAKSWNRGPHRWNASLLGFDEYSDQTARHRTLPQHRIDSSSIWGRQSPAAFETDNPPIHGPQQLCNWSIHVKELGYERIHSPPPIDAQEYFDPADCNDEENWKIWNKAENLDDFAQVLQSNLENNGFSTIKSKDLPVSSTRIAETVKRDPNELRQEAFGFAIMARNIELVVDMLDANDFDTIPHGEMFPLHLAATYLDGSKACCNILNYMVEAMPAGEGSVRKLYTNHLGHTVLDNLMVTILKAHTSCSPGMVDDAFKKEKRFAGEEVNICGRWDADSECIRQLHASGHSRIPVTWKHMFCHTSVQAICHSIGALFGPPWGPDINTPSGLFTKRCKNPTCGLKLQLLPLHTLVVITVHLAMRGSPGETLFGMLACLLCLLSRGADPLLKAPISLEALLGDDDDIEDHVCSHMDLSPMGLVQMVPDELVAGWQDDVKIGWEVFRRVINLSHKERSLPYYDSSKSAKDSYDEESSQDYCHEHKECYFGKNRDLSRLWAAVQTEFTTYRRRNEDDRWISSYFDMQSLLLTPDPEDGFGSNLELISRNMMRENYCNCGIFEYAHDEVCVCAEDVSQFHFANLEDWNRTTFIETMIDRMAGWY